MSGLEQLPVEMLELFLLQLDIVTLKSMCSSSKHMATICQDPYFRKAYKNTHRFSIQLKELFIHLGRIDHLNECPLQQYRHRYIAHGIAPAVAERMAVDKVLLKFLSSPKKTTNTIVKCYEDPFERLLHGQQLRQVTKVAHETLMEKGSSAWLERFKYHDFTNVIDREDIKPIARLVKRLKRIKESTRIDDDILDAVDQLGYLEDAIKFSTKRLSQTYAHNVISKITDLYSNYWFDYTAKGIVYDLNNRL